MKIPKVVDGLNEFWINYDPSHTSNLGPIWEDYVAVYHTPGKVGSVQKLPAPMPVGIAYGDGVFGEAGIFDGGHVRISNAPILDVLFPNMSISAWVRPKDIQTDWEVILGRGFDASPVDDFILSLSFPADRIYGCAGKSCTTTPYTPNQNKWMHLAMVFNGDNLSLFLDGEKVSENNKVREKSMTDQDVFIGANSNDGDLSVEQFFHGEIDEIRITGEVLEKSAIRMEYNASAPLFFTIDPKESN